MLNDVSMTPCHHFQIRVVLNPVSSLYRRDRGSEHPASRTLHSRFPPPSIAAPASEYFSYCEILCQCCEIFPISPGFRPF